MNRRHFLGSLAIAPLLPLAAKLPASAPVPLDLDELFRICYEVKCARDGHTIIYPYSDSIKYRWPVAYPLYSATGS